MPAGKNNNVAIIDFMLGNLFSVKNACEFVGLNPTITSDKDEILNSDAAIQDHDFRLIINVLRAKIG